MCIAALNFLFAWYSFRSFRLLLRLRSSEPSMSIHGSPIASAVVIRLDGFTVRSLARKFYSTADIIGSGDGGEASATNTSSRYRGERG